MDFLFYDIIFLILFGIFVILFLYKNRKNLQRDMKIAFLYKTQFGIKVINYIGIKYKKIINVLKYFSIFLGYILMISVIYLGGRAVYQYLRYPQLTEIIKAPPLAPVIPYFPQLFGLKSFFPPFYFTYFIISILVVATVHEFSHGIFAKAVGLKIKSTGFAFLGPFLGAFVEPDEKKMAKKSKADQMGILSAGVFSNLIFAGVFLLILTGVFYLNFVPSGALFDTYSTSIVNVSSINKINGIIIENNTHKVLIENIEDNISEEIIMDLNGDSQNLTRVYAGNKSYLVSLKNLKEQLETGTNFVRLYGDYPAINAGLKGAIIEIQGEYIRKYSDLSEIMENYGPGDKINIKTKYKEEIIEYNITLAQHPNNENKGIIGIGNTIMSTTQIEYTFAFFREPFTNYQAKSEFVSFIYYLIFWIFLLNFLVALFNMLPFAILDGGRFFYLTVLGIIKNEKISEKIYKYVGMLILFFLLLMMVVWFFRII